MLFTFGRLFVKRFRSWEEHFGGSFSLEITNGSARIDITVLGQNYIHNAHFFGLRADSGGAIKSCFADSSNFVLVEECTFFDCVAGSSGGVILMETRGNCKVSKSCIYECYSANSNYEGTTIRVHTYWGGADVAQILSTSLTHVNHPGGRPNIYFKYGHHTFKYANISRYKTRRNPCFITEGLSTTVVFSTFANNVATTNSICTLNSNANSVFVNSNIISNKQGINQVNGLIHSFGRLNISFCCIMYNQGSPLFGNSGNSNFTVFECCINQYPIETIGPYIDLSAIGTKTFINALHHYVIGKCDSIADTFLPKTFSISFYWHEMWFLFNQISS